MMDKYDMPLHIRAHSILVARIAMLIASKLDAEDVNVSIEKSVSGALMHDIAKFSCIQSHEDHCQKGKDICENEGFDEIADIVYEHVVLRNPVVDDEYNEKEIVNYADKRVLHDQVVSLQARMDDIKVRYLPKCPHIDISMFNHHHEICKIVEQKLFTKLSFLPQDLPEYLTNIIL
jgi:putative nucleotidyltransferase with HDIG domain